MDMDITFTLFAVLGFLAVVLALEGGYNLWAGQHSAEAQRLQARLAALQGLAQGTVQLERAVPRTPAQRWIESRAAGRTLTRWVAAAGLPITAAELLGRSALLAAGGLVLPVLLGQPLLLGLAAALVLGALPALQLSRQRQQRIQRLERQFPEALDMMGRAMRAGHSFPTAIRMVGDEVAEPLGADFRLLADELNYGVPAPDALAHFADRIPLADVRYFVVAVMIQREAGGNLAELLDNISAIVRARLTLLGEVRTLSSEGRLSATILTALPFVLGLAIHLINPVFMSALWTDPTGQRMVGVSLLAIVVGVLWMRKIIRIRV
jgi:tight adherence protein B